MQIIKGWKGWNAIQEIYFELAGWIKFDGLPDHTFLCGDRIPAVNTGCVTGLSFGHPGKNCETAS